MPTEGLSKGPSDLAGASCKAPVCPGPLVKSTGHSLAIALISNWRCAKTPYQKGDYRMDISWDISCPRASGKSNFPFLKDFL